ncbi:MAG: polyprenyl synthetase family protein [Bacillota bacterium]|nr:polyprenyl synthetase family protein [Bacillota bacterium]
MPDQAAVPHDFQARYQAWQDKIERALPVYVGEQNEAEGGLVVEAARYSLLAGGKRLRPVLFLAVTAMLGQSVDRILPFACAVEMIHTYSLIHDDLPCMDDDDLRRGRPTCHKVFGEAMAVLAGDYLLNRAYEVLLDAIDPDCPETVTAVRLISRAAGGRGMIGGQVLDLIAEQQKPDAKALEQMHRMKTGALLSAPVEAAALLACAEADAAASLAAFGAAIGLAFQIRDDILDVTSDAAIMGKTTGKDDRDGKSTYVTLFGLTQAGKLLEQATCSAQAELDKLEPDYDISFLRVLTRYLGAV